MIKYKLPIINEEFKRKEQNMEKTYVNVIKRNGTEVGFDITKIENAIAKANAEVDNLHKLNEYQVKAIADNVADQISKYTHAIEVEEIQDLVERAIMEMRGYEVAQKYVRYRYKRNLARKQNTTDEEILELVERNNELVKQENSNKNPIINSTQRDYIAGQVSKDITERILLPQDIVEAHQKGIIHFHDADYFIQHMHNCDLVNMEDILQNGTVISGIQITRPHSFQTAANICTQVVAQVASNQYGGQSFSLAHLAPFVDVSRQKIKKALEDECRENGIELTEKQKSSIIESRLKTEIKAGIQTIQYQLVTLMTTNG